MADKSMAVKEEIVKMLIELMTEIGDRYDHQTRLIIYHFLFFIILLPFIIFIFYYL